MMCSSQLLKLAVILAAAVAGPAIGAQQMALPDAPDARDAQWKRVETISLGTPIIVRSDSGHVNCILKHAAVDKLSCTGKEDVDFSRESVRKVETYNRAGSSALFAALGAGIGVMTVEIVAHAMGGNAEKVKGPVLVGGAGMGAIAFFPIGYFTHPIHHAIYERR